jgi:inhibitor of KinA
MQIASYHIFSMGETAISIEFGKEISIDGHEKVMALLHVLQHQPIPWIKDIIPAYTTLTIVFDAMMVYKLSPAAPIHSTVKQQLVQMLELCSNTNGVPPRKMEIPVCYDEIFALDTKNMALEKNLSIDEIIDLHVSKTYRVYMIGFLPGFPYMAAVDEKLTTPRLSSPRSNVPAGSVGIAGEQTGIYPLDSPGGWNIIGRTPLQLFDASKENPVFLQAGDEISFKRIGMDEFHHYKPTIS